MTPLSPYQVRPSPLSEADLDELLRPQGPSEALSFEQFARTYNFRRTQDRRRLLVRFVVDECRGRPSPVRVLDVGCGRGIGLCVDFQWAIRRHADEYWGLDPDAGVSSPEHLFDRRLTSTMEAADIPADSIDVAYSFMVMEHVREPDVFLRTVHRCLRPGGVYLFMTPNLRHYFTRIARTLKRLRADEVVLKLIRRAEAEEYHYPVQYRCNDEKTIAAQASRVGFARPEFGYEEAIGPVDYMPGPLRPLFHLAAWKRSLIRNPRSLVTLTCRLTKPATTSTQDKSSC